MEQSGVLLAPLRSPYVIIRVFLACSSTQTVPFKNIFSLLKRKYKNIGKRKFEQKKHEIIIQSVIPIISLNSDEIDPICNQERKKYNPDTAWFISSKYI